MGQYVRLSGWHQIFRLLPFDPKVCWEVEILASSVAVALVVEQVAILKTLQYEA